MMSLYANINEGILKNSRYKCECGRRIKTSKQRQKIQTATLRRTVSIIKLLLISLFVSKSVLYL